MAVALHRTVAAELHQNQSVLVIPIALTVKCVTGAVVSKLAEPILAAKTHFASLLTIYLVVRVLWDTPEIPELSVIQYRKRPLHGSVIMMKSADQNVLAMDGFVSIRVLMPAALELCVVSSTTNHFALVQMDTLVMLMYDARPRRKMPPYL